MTQIWINRPTPEYLNESHQNTACAVMGIRIIEVGDDFIRGTMPVDERTVQPYGLLHGGASLLLAETLGSIAAVAMIDTSRFTSVGTAIFANHIRTVSAGRVTGTARPLHLGRSSHVWEIDVVGDGDKTVSLVRLTTTVVPVRHSS